MNAPTVAPQEANSQRLQSVCQELLAERRLILVSNRGPVEYILEEDGGLRAQRGSGGVVTALSAVGRYADLTWIAATMGDGDRKAAGQGQGERLKSPLPGQSLYLRFVDIPRNVYHKYYNVICNPLLWFLQHYMWNSPLTPNITAKTYDAWHNGYVPVNKAFAEAIVAETKDDPIPPFVLLHDYHLYLAGGLIRERLPNAILQQFIHIPWPAPSYWQLLPASMRTTICINLCANDIVGFQTMRDVRNFLHTCETLVEGAEIDYQRCTVWHKGHLTKVNAYPISIDVAELRRFANSLRVREYVEKLSPLCTEQVIVRVDRLEPSKNIVRGLRAYETLLERHAELRGKVTLLAFLVPSRTSIRQYQRYTEETNAHIEHINARFGSPTWRPIHLFYENNYAQAIAGMQLYDVLLVNAVIDGMNLVSKEGPIVNRKNGVLVLSEAVGSYEQLHTDALGVSPADLEGTTQALHQGLTMPPAERATRAESLIKTIEAEDITMWLCHQFEDLLTLA